MVLMYSKVKNILSLRWAQISLSFLAIVILGFIAFQYARIAHFPTGDDPAIHIWTIRNLSYRELFSSSSYPIPLSIFKFLQGILGIDYPKLFTLTISLFLLFSSLCVGLLTKKVSNSWLLAFIGSTIFATGGWVADGLRMGLLAETFGWGMLALALYSLVSQNIVLTLIFSGLLALSHPFSFAIFIFVAVLYLLITMFSKEKKECNFALILSLIYSIFVILIFIFDKELIMKFLNFINPERIGWGERKLWEILTTYNPRRIIVAFFALIGLISNIKNWSKPAIKISYLLLFVGLFMSMNQIFGIRFLVFRFFPYLEMGLAIFAVLGIEYLVDKLKAFKNKPLLIIGITLFAVMPHYIDNGRAVYAQVNNASLNDSMTDGDKEAFSWISTNISKNSSLLATHKRAIWLRDLTVIDVREDDLLDAKTPSDYVYYSEVDSIQAQAKNNFRLIYDKSGVKIYQKK